MGKLTDNIKKFEKDNGIPKLIKIPPYFIYASKCKKTKESQNDSDDDDSVDLSDLSDDSEQEDEGLDLSDRLNKEDIVQKHMFGAEFEKTNFFLKILIQF